MENKKKTAGGTSSEGQTYFCGSKLSLQLKYNTSKSYWPERSTFWFSVLITLLEAQKAQLTSDVQGDWLRALLNEPAPDQARLHTGDSASHSLPLVA